MSIVIQKHRSKPRKKARKSRGVSALMQSVAELQAYVDRGMTSDEIVNDIRRRHPERVRIVFRAPEPGQYPPTAVRRLRATMRMSQATFAQTLGVSCILVQSWERGVREPSPMARRLLDTISANPAAWLADLTRRAG
jgi:DNA-binding transcriptional regulator YiaG